MEKQQIKKIIREKLEYGCVWDGNLNYTKVVVFTDIDNIVEQLCSMVSTDNNLTNFKICMELDNFLKNFPEECIFFGNRVRLELTPYAMVATLEGGKVTKRVFGTKPNGEKYTAEETKVLLKSYRSNPKKSFNRFSGRTDRDTFVSIIADMTGTIDSTRRFIRSKNNQETKSNYYYSKIEQICRQAKEKGEKIIFIPYSVDEHSVILIIDVEKFVKGEKDSIVCFDSSHYFTGYFGVFRSFLDLVMEVLKVNIFFILYTVY